MLMCGGKLLHPKEPISPFPAHVVETCINHSDRAESVIYFGSLADRRRFGYGQLAGGPRVRKGAVLCAEDFKSSSKRPTFESRVFGPLEAMVGHRKNTPCSRDARIAAEPTPSRNDRQSWTTSRSIKPYACLTFRPHRLLLRTRSLESEPNSVNVLAE